jgi:hypothetical protein
VHVNDAWHLGCRSLLVNRLDKRAAEILSFLVLDFEVMLLVALSFIIVHNHSDLVLRV